MNKFRQAVEQQDAEIYEVAARYVNLGFSPWEAMQKAVDHIRIDKAFRRAAEEAKQSIADMDAALEQALRKR